VSSVEEVHIPANSPRKLLRFRFVALSCPATGALWVSPRTLTTRIAS